MGRNTPPPGPFTHREQQRKSRTVTHPDQTNPAHRTALSILVVDDDILVREVTAGMLADAGHRVHEAANGRAALDLLATAGPIDLLITDVNMPGMDGLELVRAAHARWPDLPVLLVSGRPQPPGTQPFIAKPFGWNTLVDAVGDVVDRPAHTTTGL